MTKLIGVDFSHWQSKMPFEKLVEAGISFAIFKAGERLTSGKYYNDPEYPRNIYEGNAKGLITGAYYYYHPSQGAPQQFNHFIGQMDKWGYPDLPPVIDVEDNDGLSPAHCANELKKLLDMIEDELHVQPIIYTRNGFWVNKYGYPAWGEDYKFWLAQYPIVGKVYHGQPYYGKMANPSEGINAIMWQFTDSYRIAGVPNVDGNYFFGDISDLIALTWDSGNIPPEYPPTTDPPESQAGKIREVIPGMALHGRKSPIYGTNNYHLSLHGGVRFEMLDDEIHINNGVPYVKAKLIDEDNVFYISKSDNWSREA